MFFPPELSGVEMKMRKFIMAKHKAVTHFFSHHPKYCSNIFYFLKRMITPYCSAIMHERHSIVGVLLNRWISISTAMNNTMIVIFTFIVPL